LSLLGLADREYRVAVSRRGLALAYRQPHRQDPVRKKGTRFLLNSSSQARTTVVVELLSDRPDARTMLRAVGLRVTNPRVAVLDALHDHPHSTADTVAVHARDVFGVGVHPGGV